MSPSHSSDDLPMLLFERPEDWADWLMQHHTSAAGVWMRLAKKQTGIPSISYAEALDVALCYGWIDSQKKSYDEDSWLQRWTPRGARSIWSKVNRAKAEQLIASQQMQPAGLAAVAAAQRDGRWAAAYDSPSNATVPDDFAAALAHHPAAQTFFATLDSRNRYAMLHRIQTAKKPETRAKRIRQFVEMLDRNEKLYP